MAEGAALPPRVPGRAGWELRLVVHGGWRILEKIARMDLRIDRPAAASARQRRAAAGVAQLALPRRRGSRRSGCVTPEQYVQRQGGAERLVVLLRVHVPAAAAPRSDHRVLRVLPRGRRRGRRGTSTPVSRRPSWPGGARRWRRAFAGAPDPSGDAGADAADARRTASSSRHLLAVIEGCQMDLDQTRYLDFAALRRYCHLVAGVVGEVAANIFGRTSERTVDYAHTLGLRAAAHQHHPRRRRRCAPRPHLPADGRDCSASASRPPRSCSARRPGATAIVSTR